MNQDYFRCPVCSSDETIFGEKGRECAHCGTSLRMFVEKPKHIWRHGRLSGYQVLDNYGWHTATPDEVTSIFSHLFGRDE